jgi:hypothetical protein
VLGISKLIKKARDNSEYAVNATFWGFVYLMGVIVFLLIFNLGTLIFPPTSPVIEVCQKDVDHLGMDWKRCAMIKEGSLYEKCVKKAMPNVTGCSKFMIS